MLAAGEGDGLVTLKDFFNECPRAALGLSGGVDSAYLLYAGLGCGADIRPYYIKTAFQPRFELDDALTLTKQLGVELRIVELDVFSVPAAVSNGADRCYHCKKALFSELSRHALADGYNVLIDGTNASDDADDRPGMRALRELSVRSPLRECGLTKEDIRRLSKEAGLFTWDKPSYTCLATRIPEGEKITQAVLRRVEGAENALSRLGYSDFRVRVFGGAARLQLKKDQMEKAAFDIDAIKTAVTPFFETVLLDLAGR